MAFQPIEHFENWLLDQHCAPFPMEIEDACFFPMTNVMDFSNDMDSSLSTGSFQSHDHFMPASPNGPGFYPSSFDSPYLPSSDIGSYGAFYMQEQPAASPMAVVGKNIPKEKKREKPHATLKMSREDKLAAKQARRRQARPKVVESKGAVQCVGKNRKKGTQCRNAALMEYIGPRPVYCAEHIELDPNSLYEKCKSGYQKEVGDGKNCKEVVLKEFGLCYKHYSDKVQVLISNRDMKTAKRHHVRIEELLEQLEREAAVAKKKDGDLYQRKNKLIPKFQEMKKLIISALNTMGDTSVTYVGRGSRNMNSVRSAPIASSTRAPEGSVASPVPHSPLPMTPTLSEASMSYSSDPLFSDSECAVGSGSANDEALLHSFFTSDVDMSH